MNKHLQNNKRLVALLILLLGVAGMTKSFAYEFSAVCSTGQKLYYNITDAANHYVALTYPGSSSNPWGSYDKPIGNLVLPDSVVYNNNYYVITSISQYAFYGCDEISQVTIPTGVTSVGDKAFWNCPSLQTVYFNAINCTSMYTCVSSNYYSVFSSDGNGAPSAITRVVVGDSVTRIPNYAFKNAVDIYQRLVIPASVTEIGNYAFYNCNSMVQMVIQGNGLQIIGQYAFYGCSALANALNLPNSVTTVGQYAFYRCSVLPSVTIGTGMAIIEGYAFWNCPALVTVNFNATNCTQMYTRTYDYYNYRYWSVFNSGTSNDGATPIVTLTIGDNVTNIPDYAFRNSTNLTSTITIPNATTIIGTYAFYGCSSIPELTIGEGVTSIGEYAFWNCPNMATVNFNATNCTSMVTNSQYAVFNSGTSNTGATPIVTLTIGDNVTNIPDYAFRNSSNAVGALTLPGALTNIGQYAFQNCSGFTGDLAIPNTVTTIGQYAFSDCFGFNGTLTLPVNESFNIIDQYAFNGCSGLGTLTIPANVIEVEGSAFRGCSNLVQMVIQENGLQIIGQYAFYGCTALANALNLPNSVTTVGQYAFYGCSSIPELTIGEGVTSIGGYAFWNCPAMATVHFNATNCTSMVTNVYSVFNSGTSNTGSTPIVTLTLGENVTKIPAYAFTNSSNLTGDLIIPNSVTSIEAYAFANCSGHNVFTGKNVTSISNHAFYYSNGFNGTLLLGDALTSIGYDAFNGCSGFTGDLVIPNSVTYLGHDAFKGCSGFNGSLIIGSGVTTINENTFANCSGFLGSLIVGRQVNSIGNYAFKNCSGFTVAISENPTPPTAVANSFQSMTFTIPLYVPYAMMPAYQNATGWSQFTNRVEQCVFDLLDNDLWSDEQNWYAYELPGPNDVVCVNSNCHLDMDANVLHLYVLNLNDVLTINGGQSLTTTYGVGTLQASQLVITDGGSLYNPISNAYGTIQRSVDGYGTGENGWYTVASPIYGGTPINPLTIGNYDLYTYDEPTHYWMNEKHEQYTELTVAQGFLYANQTEQALSLSGQLVASNAEISIPVTRTAHELPGLNLVGNPYTNNISISQVQFNDTPLTAYYKGEGGSGLVAHTDADNDPIKPGEGFMVTAAEGGTLTFTPATRSANPGSYVRLVLSGPSTGSGTVVADRAYLRVDGGETLGKLRAHSGQSLLYFKQGDESYAVANNPNEALLCFEPAATATYTIEAATLNAQCSYLHLIDHLTGNDIDLLATPTYTFDAAPTDPVARFDLAFSPDANQVNRNGEAARDGSCMMPIHNLVDNQNAYYDGNPFSISAVADPNAGGTVTGVGTYLRGATCTLTATPNTNYTFVNWTKNGEEVSANSTYSFVVTDGGEYVAHFNPIYEIVATANPTEGGTVTGAGPYENGTTATLEATPSEGYVFYCWTKGDGLVVSSSSSYSFTVTEEASFVAHFVVGGEIEIGSGTNTNTYLPSYSYYNYSLTQQIYTADEIGLAGTIYSLAFFNGGSTKTRNYTIYMVHTDKSTFHSNTDWISVTASDQVFSGSVTMSANTWTTMELTAPFTYNGTSNLVIVVDDNTGTWSSGMACRVYDANGNQAIRVYSDNLNYNPYSPTSYNGTLHSVKNQIILGMGVGAGLEICAIAATANPVVGGTVEGAGNYLESSTCTLTAIANSGYDFLNWMKNDTIVSTNAEYSFIVTEASNYVANFVLNGYDITAIANPTEGGIVSGSGLYNSGATATLTATANTGYTFVNWTKNGQQVSTNATYTFTVTEAGNYVANFSLNNYEITVMADPVAGGMVSGGGTYVHGATATLTATANEGYTFLNWTKGGEVVSTNATYSFTVTEAASYVANFELNTYEITVTANPAEGGTVTGAGTYGHGTTVTLTATANEGYTFLNWTKGGEVVSTNATYSFTVIEEAALIANFEATITDITQTTDFVTGWTWWSSSIETEEADVLDQLKNGLGASGQVIKSQTASTMHLGNNWVGSLTLSNENGYMVKANGAVTVDITGPAATPESHPITLTPGWTWIGYPCSEPMTVSEALANHTPQANDVIKGQNASAMYMAGQWRGALTLTPGIGLMYKSNSTGNKTLTYATPTRMTETEPNLVETHWNANHNAYPTNMTVLAVVELDGKELALRQAQGPDANYELAAFANGECRGSVAMMYVEPLDRYMALLTISGEEAAELHFGLYNTETGEECFATDETPTYETDAVIGSPDEPFVIRFRSNTGVDEWSNSLQVFPNPVERGQSVSLSLSAEEMGEIQVEIINALGMVETVCTPSQQRIIAPKVSGVYTLRITVEGKGTCYRKLVVR